MTPWVHGVGSHVCWYRVAPPSGLWHRGTPVSSTSTRGTMTVQCLPLADLCVHQCLRAKDHSVHQVAIFRSFCVPRKSSPAARRIGGHLRVVFRKVTGDLATQRGAGDPAQRKTAREGRTRPRRMRGVQVSHRSNLTSQQDVKNTSPPLTASSPGRYTNTGLWTCVCKVRFSYTLSGRPRKVLTFVICPETSIRRRSPRPVSSCRCHPARAATLSTQLACHSRLRVWQFRWPSEGLATETDS